MLNVSMYIQDLDIFSFSAIVAKCSVGSVIH